MKPLDPPCMSATRAGACILLGAVGLLVIGIQPALYGDLVREGILFERQVGFLTAAEVTAIAVGSAIAVPVLRFLPAGRLVVLSLLMLVAGNLVHPAPGGFAVVLAARAFSGLGGGMLSAIAYVAIAQTARIGRWMAAFQLLQACLGFLAMAWMTVWIPNAGSPAIQYCLCVIYILSFAMAPLVWRLETPIASVAGDRSHPSGAGILGLFAVLVFAGAAIGIWAYTGVWLSERHVPAQTIATMLTWSLLAQMSGAVLSIFISDIRHATRLFCSSLLAMAGSMYLWSGNPESMLLPCLFGFAWTVVTSMLARMLALIDPSRKAVPYAGAAQMTGVAVLPGLIGYALGGNLHILMLVQLAIFSAGGMLLAALSSHSIRSRSDDEFALVADAPASL